MIVAFFSDKTKHRFAFTLVPIFVAITGFAILLTVHNKPHTQYAALFLVAMGSYSAMPVIVCWFNMNLGGHHRRAIGTAWQIGFGKQGLMEHNLLLQLTSSPGNIGGIIATLYVSTSIAQTKRVDLKTGYTDNTCHDLVHF